jgi:hypothetical protein
VPATQVLSNNYELNLLGELLSPDVWWDTSHGTDIQKLVFSDSTCRMMDGGDTVPWDGEGSTDQGNTSSSTPNFYKSIAKEYRKIHFTFKEHTRLYCWWENGKIALISCSSKAKRMIKILSIGYVQFIGRSSPSWGRWNCYDY